MKYFTNEWWVSGCNDAEALFQRYEMYLASIRPQLPPELLIFERDHTFHDSKVKNIINDFNGRSVTMVLNGWTQNLEYPARYRVRFSDVSLFEQQFPPQDCSECELGDLGYWEYAVIDSAIEIKMLFSSSAELRIIFNRFDFQIENKEVQGCV